MLKHKLLTDLQVYFMKSVEDRWKSIFEAAYSNKSRAKAVKAKCVDCSCFQAKEITLCTAETCPLWRFRPYQNEEKYQIMLKEIKK